MRIAVTAAYQAKRAPTMRDIDPVARGPEQIPAEAERVGRERNDVLALDQQEREIMREVIADRDRDQREGEAAAPWRAAPGVRPATALMSALTPQIGAEEHEPEGDAGRRC